MVLGFTLVTIGMNPTTIIMAPETVLSAGMVEPATTMASAPSLAALE
jgi:hypothetical protein